jgi:putative transposase
MIDRRSQLSVTLQAKLLGIGRGSDYYRPRAASESDLKLMQRIDRLQLELPFVGRLHNGESGCRTTGMLLVAL